MSLTSPLPLLRPVISPARPAPPAADLRSAVCFSRRFCADRGCAEGEFVPAVMRICISPRARPGLALLGRSNLFAADRELVEAVAYALSMAEVRHAIDDYWSHPANRSWLRRMLGLRISTLRLRRLASDYVPFALPRFGRGYPPASP